ncbi:Abi family protein [Candidatus Gracilibacteria bacterium]|nr:Abi family protein [Candidatus Gracilibacteria bacterium]
MQFSKTPLNIHEQVNLLRSRGLIIRDESHAIAKLEHIGYYRLSGYFKFFQKGDNTYLPDVTFEKVLDIYIFDRKLRLHTLDAIERIEVSLKSNISNTLSILGGCFWYKNRDFFDLGDHIANDLKTPEQQDRDMEINKKYEEMLEKFSRKKSKSSSVFISSYNEKYNEENLPSWMLFEELTIGEVSNIYRILKQEYRQTIATIYGVYSLDLSNWMQMIITLRNISAHHARLWNRRYTWKPRTKDSILQNKYIKQKLEDGRIEVIPSYFNSCLVISYLLKIINPGSTWNHRLESLIAEFPNISKKSMGFDDDSFEKLRSIG